MVNKMKIHPLIQETVEALAVIGGNLKRYRRKLTIQCGEIEKLISDIERIEKFICKREQEIKEIIDKEIN